MGVSPGCIWEIEDFEDELSCCYSPCQARQFCNVLGAHPSELFGVVTKESAVSAGELVERIHAECRKRNVTLEQFEDAVGWRWSQWLALVAMHGTSAAVVGGHDARWIEVSLPRAWH
jgi:hypothetical protein